MTPPKRGEPHWDVYVAKLEYDIPWRRVASCLDADARDAVCRLYAPGEACWAEVIPHD